MATAAECSKYSIMSIDNNLRWFGTVRAGPFCLPRLQD